MPSNFVIHKKRLEKLKLQCELKSPFNRTNRISTTHYDSVMISTITWIRPQLERKALVHYECQVGEAHDHVAIVE